MRRNSTNVLGAAEQMYKGYWLGGAEKEWILLSGEGGGGGEGASQEKGQLTEALGVMAPATPGKGRQA